MIERIIQISLKYRYLVILATVVAVGLGIRTLQHLPIDAVPDITNNQVQINTVASNLSPDEVEKQVTFPIETALLDIPGLEQTRSLTRNGFSQVTAIFDDAVDIYFARQQISERLQEAKESLPEGAEPHMGPISTGLGEVYMWSISFDTPPDHFSHIGWQPDGTYRTPEGEVLDTEIAREAYLRTVQDWIVTPQLKKVKGLAGVDAIGGYVKQYVVQPYPDKLIAMGLHLSNLEEALQRNNRSIGAGYIEQQRESYVVRGNARLRSIAEIADVVIAKRNGTAIRVRDVADVAIGKELRTGSATVRGEEAVIGTALMLIGENSRTVAQAVHDRLQEVGPSLPPGIKLTPLLNRTKLVDATIHTVATNLAEGALLVIAILFLLLGNFRAALITAMIIPFSMALTAVGMVRMQISGNLMSLGALDFGLIVDGTVIIAENCLRRLVEKQRQLGRSLDIEERLQEVFQATKEMIQPTVFGQGIILTVYFPLLTLGGIEGKMFQPMALTVIFALVSAFLLSLTFTPAAIALFMGGKIQEKERGLMIWASKLYKHYLEKVIGAPKAVLGGASALVVFAIFLFSLLGQEFVPTLDEQDIAVQAMRMPSTSLTQSTEMHRKVEKKLLEMEEVATVFSKTGTAEMASDPMPPNLSDTFIMLKPRNEWPDPKLSKDALIDKMEHRLEELAGNMYEFTQPIEMRFNELISGIRSDVAVKIYGDDFDTMHKVGAQVAGILSTIPGAADIKVAQTHGLPSLDVRIDYRTIDRLPIDPADILETLHMAVGGSKVGEILEGDRRFDLIVRLPEELRADPQSLEMLPLPLHTDDNEIAYLPLKEAADVKITEGLNEITRQDGKRLVIVQANVRGNDLGTFVTEAKAKIAKELDLPPGYWTEWGGQFEHLLSAKRRLLIVVPICFFLILGCLVAALKSVRLALLVFSSVPLSITGGVITLWLRGMPFSISAAVGFIALSGIAVLNGLVLITAIEQRRQSGMPFGQALREGALMRLRPVLMTALVASLGFIPMALATGTGAEVQKPLATVVIGGLISATLLTLFVLPALYQLFGDRKGEA